MESLEKILFESVQRIGEGVYGHYHIIDTSDEYPVNEEDRKFRVYHSKGYCFDVERETEYNDETGEEEGFHYSVFDDYDDFKNGSVTLYIKLLN